MTLHPTDSTPVTLADHGYFFVGAQYSSSNGFTYAHGGMYVEKYQPANENGKPPVVMIHGGGQTGTNFLGTPDGRRGWLHDFLRAGYTVFIVDQPERGRSGHAEKRLQGDQLVRQDVSRLENYFTAPGEGCLWPQSRHHSQWPGSGQKGDPAFDQFYVSQINSLWDRHEIERLSQQAGVELLDRIGPAIVLTHSQSGPIGWLLADARPQQVTAILALEPNGPPFFDVQFSGGEDWYEYNEQEARPYGLTRAPLSFDPPLPLGENLEYEKVSSDNNEYVSGYQQKQPARQLPNLKGIPIMIMVAEASYHAPYDHLTSRFLTEAGVEHDFVYLADKGFRGNGHMVMLEKNNHEIADFMIEWLAGKN